MRGIIWFACLVLAAKASAMSLMPQVAIPSPDGKILVTVTVNGGASYVVSYAGQEILRKSQLGLVRDDADFTQSLGVTANYSKRQGATVRAGVPHPSAHDLGRCEVHRIRGRGGFVLSFE